MTVFIVVYTHKYGVDASAFRTHHNAINYINHLKQDETFDEDLEVIDLIETPLGD